MNGVGGFLSILVRSRKPVDYCVYAMNHRKDLNGDHAAYFRLTHWDGLGTIGLGMDTCQLTEALGSILTVSTCGLYIT